MSKNIVIKSNPSSTRNTMDSLKKLQLMTALKIVVFQEEYQHRWVSDASLVEAILLHCDTIVKSEFSIFDLNRVMKQFLQLGAITYTQ